MFNNKLIKILGACILLFILSFGLISSVYAGNPVNNVNNNNAKGLTSVKSLAFNYDDYDDDDWDDDLDDDYDDYDDDLDDDYDDDWDDDLDDDYDDDAYDNDYLKYYKFEWKGSIYYIDLDTFNLTDEELTELFTKRDNLIEEINNLQSMIEEMELSRSNDTILTIDSLYEAINNIINNTEFNDLLLSLKDINITEVNSTFSELKSLLESLKLQYPDEDFTEIDSLMDSLEILLNEELERYENLTLERDEKLAELSELYEKYPFLSGIVGITTCTSDVGYSGGSGDPATYVKGVNKNTHRLKGYKKVSASMENTGIPYFSLAILLLVLFGLVLKRNSRFFISDLK